MCVYTLCMTFYILYIYIYMMLTERLLEVWVALFRVCWERERVPTMWRESVVVPVPKKQVRGV